MKYAAFCSDLDGTFLSQKNDVSDFAVAQIKKIKEEIPIVLASARMPKSMDYLQERLNIVGHPMICYNGALIIRHNKTTSLAEINVDLLETLLKKTNELNIDMGLYHENDWQVPKDSIRVQKEIFNTQSHPTFAPTLNTLQVWKSEKKGAHKVMLMATKESADVITPYLDTFKKDLQVYRSNDTLIELTSKSVSKLTALKMILGEDSLENTLAFGDNYNDLEMLQAVGHGVAVSNGRETVKQAANYITKSCKEDGVAYFLEQHL